MGIFDGILQAVAGPVVGGLFSMAGQDSANDANAQAAAQNRSWQEEMSNTAHQREVKDLIAAGLNPMLSAKLGGASTPTPPTPTYQNTKAELGRTIGGVNAVQVQNTEANTRLLEAQAAKTAAEKAEIEARTPTHQAAIDEINARIPTYAADINQRNAQADEIRERINTYAPTIEEIRARTGLATSNAQESQVRIQNLHETRKKIGAEIAYTIAHTKESGARTALTEAARELNYLDQRLKAGEIDIQEYTTRIRKAEAMIKNEEVQGAAQEGKFEAAFGQAKRYIKSLNPLSGLAR